MTLKEILLKLEMIEAELDDASNQLPEYNANSDALTSLDCAKNELYCLKDEIEREILDEKALKDKTLSEV
jgi:hypothetical protein